VGGDRVEVFTLLPPAASPHVFAPSPRDLTELRNARLFVKIGLGFEFWADAVAHAGAGSGMVEIETSKGIEVIGGSADSHGKGEPVGNPHIWLDPVIAMEQVRTIRDGLIEVDPAHKEEYEKHGADYLKELAQLDAEIRETIRDLPTKAFVAMHPSWTYFAKRYGLVEAGVLEESPGREPTPVELVEIVRRVRESGARVVFSEPQLNPKAAHVLSREIGAVVLELDPVGSPDIEARSTYLKLMRYNLSVLKEGLVIR
jgi:ABC-type Zn uptake system ZnuABC Zn-binding protein ZnuA